MNFLYKVSSLVRQFEETIETKKAQITEPQHPKNTKILKWQKEDEERKAFEELYNERILMMFLILMMNKIGHGTNRMIMIFILLSLQHNFKIQFKGLCYSIKIFYKNDKFRVKKRQWVYNCQEG